MGQGAAVNLFRIRSFPNETTIIGAAVGVSKQVILTRSPECEKTDDVGDLKATIIYQIEIGYANRRLL